MANEIYIYFIRNFPLSNVKNNCKNIGARTLHVVKINVKYPLIIEVIGTSDHSEVIAAENNKKNNIKKKY